jgi:hypothetical protein
MERICDGGRWGRWARVGVLVVLVVACVAGLCASVIAFAGGGGAGGSAGGDGRLAADDGGRVVDDCREGQAGGGVSGGGPGQLADEAAEEADFGRCPISLGSLWRNVRHEDSGSIERWTAEADSSCQDAARELLLSLRDAGFELARAGYMDMAGEAWGCSVAYGGSEALVITLMPADMRAARSSGNPLRITVARICAPMPGEV